MNVFLGGTCNGSQWRNQLIAMLAQNVQYFNPVVPNWTLECQAEEIRQRETCDVCLYVVTPKATGVYSIAEVVDDSNKRPTKTIFVPLRTDDFIEFSDFQWKSIGQVSKMVQENGGKWFPGLLEVAKYLNELK